MSNTTVQLSPLRNSSAATESQSLAIEQAEHFGIDAKSPFGQTLVELATNLYKANASMHKLWQITVDGLAGLDRSDRIAWFNAKRFVSFQLAKILDNLQNPMRASYQSIVTHEDGCAAKGAYPIFDHVTALFSATPVITRTATFLFACTEWIEGAFKGREPLHQMVLTSLRIRLPERGNVMRLSTSKHAPSGCLHRHRGRYNPDPVALAHTCE